MFRKLSFTITVLAVFCIVFGSQLALLAQTSYVNTHVYTKPSTTESDYYWCRTMIDPTWGISGFLYIDTGNATYYVTPTAINFVSSTDVILSAPVTVGLYQQPGYLQAEFWTSGGFNYAGFVITSLLNPSKILDFSPGIKTYGTGYIRLKLY